MNTKEIKINERIKYFRINHTKNDKGKHYSQRQLAEALGVSHGVINNIESNNVDEAKDYVIKLICAIFNVNERWLRHGEEPVFKNKIDYKTIVKNMKLKQEMIKMILELEEGDIEEAYKALILLWDKDYTRLTTEEEKELEKAIEEIENGEYYTHEEMLKELKINEQWLKK